MMIWKLHFDDDGDEYIKIEIPRKKWFLLENTWKIPTILIYHQLSVEAKNYDLLEIKLLVATCCHTNSKNMLIYVLW